MVRRRLCRTGYRCAALLAACLLWPSAFAQVPAGRHRFEIARGPVASALEQFARQSGRQIIFPTEALADRVIGPISGVRDDADVLGRLLHAGDLVVAASQGPTLILQPKPPSLSDDKSAPQPRPRAIRRHAPPTHDRQAATAEDIVVTALKRRQAALTVPNSMTVLSGQDLGDLGIRQAGNLEDVVPSLATSVVAHGISFNIRGITTTDISSKGDQGVAFNIDGIFIGRPIEQAVALFDIDRIEVLRGPQGTLYGKSSTGGAINVITNKPVDHWEAHAELEAGNFATHRGQAFVNIPLADWIAVRAAGNFNHHSGFLAPVDGSERKSGEDDQTGRLSALAHLSPSVDARLTLTLGHVGGSGTGYAELGNFINGPSSTAKRQVDPNPFPAHLDHRFVNLDGELDADLGGAQLTYVGARQRFDGFELSANNNDPKDPDVTGFPFDPATQLHGRFVTRITSDEHELRVSGSGFGWADYVVGANFFHERIDENDHTLSAPGGSADPALSTNVIDVIGSTFHRSYGVFGQSTLHLTDTLGLVAGIRYSRDSVRRRGTSAFGLFDADGDACDGLDDCIGSSASGKEGAGKLTYRLGLDYRPSSRHLIYAWVATGYKAGGFNDATAPGGAPTAYAPEQLTAFELGYKGRPTSSLMVESSAFYYDYSRTQINGVIFVNGAGVLNTRIVPTRIYGWEGSLAWTPQPDLKLRLSTTIEGSRYVRFRAGYLQNIDWSGLPLDRVPTLSAIASIERSWLLADGWSLSLSLLSKVSSHYYVSDFTSGLRYRQGGYTRSEACLTMTAPGDRWYFQLYARNIENRLQATSPPQNYDPGFLNAAYLNISDPRTYGIRVGMNFR